MAVRKTGQRIPVERRRGETHLEIVESGLQRFDVDDVVPEFVRQLFESRDALFPDDSLPFTH